MRYLCCGLCDSFVTILSSTALRVGFGCWSTEDCELCFSSSSNCSKAAFGVTLGCTSLCAAQGLPTAPSEGAEKCPLIIPQMLLGLPQETATQCFDLQIMQEHICFHWETGKCHNTLIPCKADTMTCHCLSSILQSAKHLFMETT